MAATAVKKIISIFFNIENLVLWARSEITGSALKIIQSVE
jgi:hypothetical protein